MFTDGIGVFFIMQTENIAFVIFLCIGVIDPSCRRSGIVVIAAACVTGAAVHLVTDGQHGNGLGDDGTLIVSGCDPNARIEVFDPVVVDG